MPEKPDSNTWVARLGHPGASLLGAVTTEATQKAGARLVLTSALTILVVNGVVDVTESAALGIKVEPAKFIYLVAIAGVACFYFLLLYAFDVYRERKAAEYRRLPDIVEIQRLRDEYVIEQNAVVERQNEVNRLLEERARKYDELVLSHGDAPTVDLSAPSDEQSRQLNALREWSSENRRRFGEWTAYCEADGLEELSKQQTQVLLDGTLYARANALASLLQTSRLMDNVRWGTEVFLPCGLGAVAVASALWYVIGVWGF